MSTPTTAFANFTQMRTRVPMWAWHTARSVSVSAAFSMIALLVLRPKLGLTIFWGWIVPLLPILFFLAPGLWRNICPLAASNQVPRLFRFTRGLTLPNRVREYSYVIGITLFFAIASTRKVLFNHSGPATGLLLLSVLVAAFMGGTIFKGKSGWCSTFCPLLPVQRMYGQTAWVNVPNSHCRPCVGCTKNCYDFNPRAAYLADMHENDKNYTGYRKFFVGAFPGFILAFVSISDPPQMDIPHVYVRFALYMLVSVGSFFFLDAFLRASTVKITTLYAAAALSIFYWFNMPALATRIATQLHGSAPPAAGWAGRVAVMSLALAWIGRTYVRERTFLAQAAASPPVRVAAERPLAAHKASRSGQPEVAFEPEGVRQIAEPGCPLLDIIERAGLPIEAGCRMGICGADPIAVVEGMDNLSEPGSDERSTLDRLGLAENTRMACSARVHGPVSVSLTPERAAPGTLRVVDDFTPDPNVKDVVILGNGIAGVTAADHIRRRNPACRVYLVGDEKHYFYNRMAISRLISGRSAMYGLYLLPESWYEEHDVTCWINTQALSIDRQARRVTLATGDSLRYDRLIMATGSRSFVPTMEGFGGPGTYVLRKADDAMSIRAFAQERLAQRAVVLGGGVLGLEAAHALHKLGLDVRVLERSGRLMPRQLDERASAFLRKYLEGMGLRFVMGVEADRVEHGQRQLRVVLKDGRAVRTDIVLLCAGITPNIELAVAAGLKVNRGIIVDDTLRTSDRRTLAAGDVAEHQGRVLGLWPTAAEQGEIAGINAIGGERVYTASPPPMMLKVVGVDLMSMGRFEPASNEDKVIAVEGENYSYRRLLVSRGRIEGAILLGHPLLGPVVTEAIKRGADVRPHMAALRAGDWSVLDAAVRQPVA